MPQPFVLQFCDMGGSSDRRTELDNARAKLRNLLVRATAVCFAAETRGIEPRASKAATEI